MMNRSRTSEESTSARSHRAGARTSRWQPMLPVDAAGSERAGAEEQEPAEEGEAHRCTCGSLLARLVPGGVELKCRRCKRIAVLAFSR
ncbi:MAG TPA: hypothetical protein VJU61_00540 [Polyangiaceae bacterium]|nr:hypothetical protein [Polyangiaceae bacterium]